MKEKDFEARLKQALSERPALPSELESALFARAEDLLATRRARITAREADARNADAARLRRSALMREMSARVIEFFALHPDSSAAAAMLAVLLLAFSAAHGGFDGSKRTRSAIEPPELPKINDVPARYDAELLAERQAYEREVEDAHRRTSGGN